MIDVYVCFAAATCNLKRAVGCVASLLKVTARCCFPSTSIGNIFSG